MTARGGRPPLITTEQVLDAAIECATADGLAGCTMRAVAERLRVTPMALYRHVRDKDGLLALMPDVLLADVAAATLRCETGVQALRAIAFGLSAVLEAHPWATRLFEQPQSGRHMLAAAEHSIRLLVADGATSDQAFRWIRAVVAQVIGESLTAHGPFDPTGVELLLSGLPLTHSAGNAW